MRLLIEVGDRIVSEIPGASGDCPSGIVGMSTDCGGGLYNVLLYGGKTMNRGNLIDVFDVDTVFVVDIDVVERGCKVPVIPLNLKEVFTKAVGIAAKDCAPKYAASYEMHTRVGEEVLAKFRDSLRGLSIPPVTALSDDVLEYAICQEFLKDLRARRDTRDEGTQDCVRDTFSSLLTVVKDIAADIRRGTQTQ